MMEQLGIKALRPGPSGNESAPNHANYDEALANPYPRASRRPDAEERQESDDAPSMVEAAAPRDCRGLRPRSARPRADERAEGDLEASTAPSTSTSAAGRSSARSSSAPSTTRRIPDITVEIQMTRRHAGGRDEARAGDDDVRRAIRHATCARHAAADRRAASVRDAAWPGAPGGAPAPPPIHPRPSSSSPTAGATPRSAPAASRRTTAPGLTKGIIGLVNKGQRARAGRLGRAARVGVGRVARPRLPRDRQGGRREEGRHRRRVALRQGRAGHDGLRPALRGRADRLVRRRRREAASPQFRRSGREPHRLRRVSLDGRQLPEVRRRGVDVRHARPPATFRSMRTSCSRSARRA